MAENALIYFKKYVFTLLNKKTRISIITDDPPVGSNVYSWGMCPVNTRIFTALSDNIDLIVTGTHNGRYKKEHIEQSLREKLVELPEIPYILKRLSPNCFAEYYSFKLLSADCSRKASNMNSDWLFCPCGVNPYSLWRGVYFAKKVSLPLAVYLVDDFLSGAMLSNNRNYQKFAEQYIPKLITKVQKIFVISEGMQKRIKDLYNMESTILHLPYNTPKKINFDNIEHKKQIIFVGNISHFYVEGLKQIATLIDRINKVHDENIQLRFTLPNCQMVQNLIGDYDFIVCKPCDTDNELYQEIGSSLFCFAPYSFEEKYETMVSTSFPSKMLDYLSSAKLIITYGPSYSTSVKYFKQHGLNQVFSIPEIKELQDIVLDQLHNPKNYNEKYRTIVEQYHSSNVIARKIISTLNEERI